SPAGDHHFFAAAEPTEPCLRRFSSGSISTTARRCLVCCPMSHVGSIYAKSQLPCQRRPSQAGLLLLRVALVWAKAHSLANSSNSCADSRPPQPCSPVIRRVL